jgi:MraZ protein
MLIGSYTSNLSPKRRVAIPIKFRQELGGNIIIAKWYEKCLILISKGNWNELFKRITGEVKMITATVRDTDRFIMGSAFELEPDNQGRVIIPNSLAEFAGLKTEVVFIGLNDKVEIWDKSEWTKREEIVSKNAEELIEELAKSAKTENA